MPQEIQNKAEYIVIFISEFARRFSLSAVQAYRYLNRYKAIDFLDEQYNVAHTQSFRILLGTLNIGIFSSYSDESSREMRNFAVTEHEKYGNIHNYTE